MTLNQDAKKCTAHLEVNPSKLSELETAQSDNRQAANDSKSVKRIHPDAFDPDIILPAAITQEEDINSEFYPGVYIP